MLQLQYDSVSSPRAASCGCAGARRVVVVAVVWCLSIMSLVAVFAAAVACPGSQTPPLIIQGKRFYDAATEQYVPIKGIAYYPRPNTGPFSLSYSVDFFTDDYRTRWERDIQHLHDLGVNAIRLYAVDPSKNHDAFMCALQHAGIYVALSLLADCDGCGIGAWVGVDATPPRCYSASVKARGHYVITTFSHYDNVLGFSAGNEVTIYADDGTAGPRQINAPCQKKFVRDMRQFVMACNGSLLPRAVPIGVENWDGNAQTFDQHAYYHCRTDPNDPLENVEWFGINSYRHCDGSATSRAAVVGWPELKAEFAAANFPGPVVFGEYGCRNPSFPTREGFEAQRTWFQTDALYSPTYSDVFAGGFVFEYSAEKKVIDDNLAFMDARAGLVAPSSVWPYQHYAHKNHGIGYFEPQDCEHDSTDPEKVCQYVRYPEYQGLLETLAQADRYTVRQRPQPRGVIPPCPPQFPALSSIVWPTDEDENVTLELCLQTQQAPSSSSLQDTTPQTPTTTAPTEAPSRRPSRRPRTEAPSLPAVVASTAIPTTDPSSSTLVDSTPVVTDAPSASATTGILAPPTPLPITETPSMAAETVISKTMLPTLATTTATTTALPSSASSSTPEENDEDIWPTVFAVMSSQCADHARCAAANLTGTCCPTVDQVVLGCCEARVAPTITTAVPVVADEPQSQEFGAASSSSSSSCWRRFGFGLDCYYHSGLLLILMIVGAHFRP